MTDTFNRLINICKSGDLSDVPTIHELSQIDIRSQNDILIKTLCEAKNFNILYWLLDLGKLLDSPYDLDSLLIVLISNMDEQTIDIFIDCITSYTKKCEQEEINKKLLEENNKKLLEEENNKKLLEEENNKKLLEENGTNVGFVKELTGKDCFYARKLFEPSITIPKLNIFNKDLPTNNTLDSWNRVKINSPESKFRKLVDSSESTDEDMPELEEDNPDLEDNIPELETISISNIENSENVSELNDNILDQNRDYIEIGEIDEQFIGYLKQKKQDKDENVSIQETNTNLPLLQKWDNNIDEYNKSQEEFKKLVRDLLNIEEFVENDQYITQEGECYNIETEYSSINEIIVHNEIQNNNDTIIDLHEDNINDNVGYDTYKLSNANETRKRVIRIIIEEINNLIELTCKTLKGSFCEYKLTNDQNKYYDELKDILTHYHYIVWAVCDFDNNKSIHIEW